MIADTTVLINRLHQLGKRILCEGANATMLDIDFGTYPFVTSSHPCIGGISTGLGLSPQKLETCIGVVKAYTTRVGSGPFPSELTDEIGEHIRKVGAEFGTTTGRPRRCGWLDLPVLHYSNMINQFTSINVTKLDVLNDLDTLKIGVAYRLDGKLLPIGVMPSTIEELARVEVLYETLEGWKQPISPDAKHIEDLPKQAQRYLTRIQEMLRIPVSWVGIGNDRSNMVTNGFDAPAV